MNKIKNMDVRIVLLIIIVILSGVAVCQALISPLTFRSGKINVEINNQINAKENIKYVFFGSKDSIIIDESKINIKKLGTYPLYYKYKNKTFSIDVNIVDTTPPEFEVIPYKIETGVNINPNELVKDIKDATATGFTFKRDYSFDEVGEKNIVIVGTDQGGNTTEKEVKVTLVKDNDPPKISKIEPIDIVENGKFSGREGVVVKDNYDPDPEVSVDTSKVDFSKVGTYTVTYTTSDRSGNKTLVDREVNIVKPIGSEVENKRKIVYLTFDDGPSANTLKVLNILKEYKVNATFFVTGNNKEYNYLLKKMHDEGNTVALHTYTHNYKKLYNSTNAYFNDLDKIGNMVKEHIGFYPKYIRFPGGSSNTISKNYKKGIMTKLTKEVKNRGFQYYDWNCDSTDASGNNVPASKIFKNATKCKENNINILFHDTDAKNTTVEALPKIIKYYKSKGYEFKAIDEASYAPHHDVNN